MPENRRNYYRILQVQPEAPPAVVKASWRALMQTARMHPDLGGDPRAAALVNEAYEVLGDPQRRREYDRSLDLGRLRGGARGTGATSGAGGAPEPPQGASPRPGPRHTDPSGWRLERCCPMCRAPLPALLRVDTCCAHCQAPLAAPPPAGSERELFGRRGATRRPRNDEAALSGGDAGRTVDARLVDLSVGGASLVATAPLPAGSAARVTTASFDAVARVVACHRAGLHWRIRLQWMTMRALQSRGVYVRATA
jgi:curved DNA-binding protein CbpA